MLLIRVASHADIAIRLRHACHAASGAAAAARLCQHSVVLRTQKAMARRSQQCK